MNRPRPASQVNPGFNKHGCAPFKCFVVCMPSPLPQAYPGFNLMAADLRCRRMAYLCSKQPEQGPQVGASWWFVAGGRELPLQAWLRCRLLVCMVPYTALNGRETCQHWTDYMRSGGGASLPYHNPPRSWCLPACMA